MLGLRNYQKELYINTREALKSNRSVCIQLATGGGKTIIFTSMCDSVFEKKKRAWIVVTRKELMNQASKHLLKWNVPHGQIKPGHEESKAFKIHIASSDTLIRRLDKIKNWPDLIIFDEAHVMLDRQKTIIEHLPITTKILGFTATPQRSDGRGLSEVYEKLIEGPSIPWLTQNGYLAPLRYFAPPIEGLSDIKRRGTEYDEEELEILLQHKKIYGKAIDHYKKYGQGRQALFFCRSVKSSQKLAEQFREQGFKVYDIDGSMNDKYRFSLVEKLNNGEIDGLCGCDVFVYGIDVPRVSYGAILRPTLSKTVYFQSIGRILRPFPGKKDALFFDHVNNILEHQETDYPGIPPHYVPKINWEFYGKEKRKKQPIIGNPKLCPHLDFMYCDKSSCINCEHNPNKSISDARKPMVVIPAQLKELEKPVALKDRPQTEQKEIADKIGKLEIEYKLNPGTGPVEKMLELSKNLGYNDMWVYWRFTDSSRRTVNIPLLAEIVKLQGHKPGRIFFMKKNIQKRMKQNNEYRRILG